MAAPPPWLILAIALGFRALWAVFVHPVPVSDGQAYDVFARNLAQGAGFAWNDGVPTAHWPAGTAFFYSLLYRLFGTGYLSIVLSQIALSLATIHLAMRTAARYHGEAAARWAGLLLAGWIGYIQFTTVLASEVLFLFLLTSAVWAWTAPDWSGRRRILATGLLVAVACHVRPTAILLPFVFPLIRRPWPAPRRYAAEALCLLALQIAVVAPWTLRNFRHSGEFVYLSTNGGSTLWTGNNPASRGTHMTFPWTRPSDPPGLAGEVAANRRLAREAKEYIVSHPGRFLALAARKFVILHARESIGAHWNAPGIEAAWGPAGFRRVKAAGHLYWLGFMILCAAGAAVTARAGGWKAMLSDPAVLIWLYFTGVHSITAAQDRYHMAWVPFAAAFAARGLIRIGERFGGRAATAQ